MKQRILTALILAPLAIAAVLWLPTAIFLAICAALLLAGLWEWARLVGLTSHVGRAALLAAHAAVMAWLAWFGWPAMFFPIAAAGAAWWLVAALWLKFRTFGSEANRGNRALKLIVGTLLTVPAWCAIGVLHGSGEYGPRWTLFALFLVWAADTFAYFTGSRIGGPKMAPNISPGKTWSGFGGGVTGALLICIPAIPLLGLRWADLPMLLVAALATALISVVGDLFESMIKRHSGAKDSGYLIPGHGGVMDRIDSIVAALPVFAVVKFWLLP